MERDGPACKTSGNKGGKVGLIKHNTAQHKDWKQEDEARLARSGIQGSRQSSPDVTAEIHGDRHGASVRDDDVTGASNDVTENLQLPLNVWTSKTPVVPVTIHSED